MGKVFSRKYLPNSDFTANAFNADEYVLAGRVVHIPQAGAGVAVKRNRTSLPATVNRRQDFDVTYALDEYTTDPILIPNAEKLELSYDKLDSVMREKVDALREVIGDWMAYHWAPSRADRILRTTGDPVPAHIGTGQRLAITLEDIRRARKLMNKLGIPKSDRFMLISSDMLEQLVKQLSSTEYRDFSRAYDPTTGTIGMLEGFKIIERAYVVRYDNSATPQKLEPTAEESDTDNDAVILWQKNAVERALGDINFFERQNDPQYYGDVYSAQVFMGGRIRRSDEAGVVAIVQEAVAA